jgi:hypothetical protein
MWSNLAVRVETGVRYTGGQIFSDCPNLVLDALPHEQLASNATDQQSDRTLETLFGMRPRGLARRLRSAGRQSIKFSPHQLRP